MQILKSKVAHPPLANELELTLEVGIARDEEQALAFFVAVLGRLEIGPATAKQSMQLG